MNHHYKLLSLTTLLISLFIFGMGSSSSVNALTYQSGVGVNFTFNPTITINVGGDLVISELTPGSSADSNIISVGVTTNASYGYNLSATVGQKNGTDALVNGSDSTKTFTNLSTTAGTASALSNFGEDTWGYSYSVDNGSNWISGSIGSTASGYAGLPLDNNDNTNERGKGGVTLISTTDPADSKSVRFKIGARASQSQPAGTYTNTINFYAVTNPTPQFLYDEVAKLNRGTLAENNISLTDAISKPTSTNKTEDTSNSGVFLYDPNVFGASSDASNSYSIYFYRGILETNPQSYGSAGSANAYPNYVRLNNDTCWRIVRTTGSGGIKMIYNGNWFMNACANYNASVSAGSSSFAERDESSQSSWYNNMAFVGYTYNDSVTDSTVATELGTILGRNTNLGLNNRRSGIKTYVEDTWYMDNMISYTDKLEPSAGYCADRTVYNTSNVLQDESTTTLPYATSTTKYIFGAKTRVTATNPVPTYGCPRGAVDLYHYVLNSSGVSNELKYPVALLTADEAALAGSGSGSSSTAYSGESYLRSGSTIWLLSPSYRSSSGPVDALSLHEDGYLRDAFVSYSYGVRPVVSLKPGTQIESGAGTSDNPWIIK